MIITFSVILTYSFQMAAILVFSLICSHVHTVSNRKFIFGMIMQHVVELPDGSEPSM